MHRLIISVFIVSYVTGLVTACSFPPSVWCSSPEISESCKVVKQCDSWHRRTNSISGTAPRVNFTLYYESLCPDCKQFFAYQLSPTFAKISQIMNLTLVPFGNAQEKKEGSKWVFTCQHGPRECRKNILETCALYLLNGVSKAFPLISCMEASTLTPEAALKHCAHQEKLDPSDIIQCVNSTLGNHLEHEMALMTNALEPPHLYVPWVTLNGVHTEKIQNEAETNLLKLICETYQGPKPSGCTTMHESKHSFQRKVSIPILAL